MDLFDELPCPVLITDASGLIQAANPELLDMVGLSLEFLLNTPIENLLPPASQIFMQTHVWPMLLRQQSVKEIYIKFKGRQNQRIPVLANGKQTTINGATSYLWVFMVALERSNFEEELLVARKRTEVTNLALQKSEHFIKTIANAMPGLMAYWDKDLFCRFANDIHKDWFGKDPEFIVGSRLCDFIGDHYSVCEPYVAAVLSGQPQHFERALVKLDGETRHTLTNYIPDTNADGEIIGFFELSSDVSLLKLTEAQLKLAQSVVQNTIEGIMVTDENGIILSVNPAFTAITGFTAEEAVGETPRILKSGRYEKDYFSGLWSEISANGRWEGETWNCHKNGNAFLTRQAITAIQGEGQPIRYLSVFNDITERWQQNEQIRHLAFHDTLTDLPNRALLMERLGQLIAATARQPANIALMFLDLDGFKYINDTLGHETGDAVLQIVAQKLQREKRIADTVARLGGDEFIILINNPLDVDEVAHIAHRIIDVIGEPMTFRNTQMHIGVSIGIAMYPDDGQVPGQLIKRADIAMYAAKKAGKNVYRFFDHEKNRHQSGSHASI